MTIFVIEDESHAEQCGEFSTFESALEELKKRAKTPWDYEPNVCPCTSWETCGRDYEIIEFDDSQKPWVEIARTPMLKVSSRGVEWSDDYNS